MSGVTNPPTTSDTNQIRHHQIEYLDSGRRGEHLSFDWDELMAYPSHDPLERPEWLSTLMKEVPFYYSSDAFEIVVANEENEEEGCFAKCWQAFQECFNRM